MGFTPVRDGTVGGNTDAFDAGMMVLVDDKVFADGDDKGSLKGQTLKVGPDRVKGVDVSVRATALQDSPALQVLYGFKNPTGHQASPEIIVESNLGSDDNGTAITDTSNGDQKFQTADRWIVTEDTTQDDGPVSHVLYGQHGDGFDAITATPGKGCDASAHHFKDGVAVRYSLHIPEHSTRYLLAFAEMHQGTSTGPALHSVEKYNDPNLSGKLLKGISGNVRRKILNWNL